MSWYNDPESGPPPSSIPSPTPSPPGPPATSGPPVPAAPPPTGPPPPPPPPFPPAAGDGSNLPQGPPRQRNRDYWIVGGAFAVALLTAVGALLVFRALSGPEELTMRQYSRQLCEEVLEPSQDQMDDITDSRDFERLVGFDIDDEAEAERGIEAGRAALLSLQDAVVSVGEFSDAHILSGSDGEDFRLEVQEAVEEWQDDFASLMTDVDELDPADEDDVSEDFLQIERDLEPLDIDMAEDQPGGELQARLFEDEEDCGGAFAGMTSAAAGG